MKLIPSFSVDHTRIIPGIYESRVDTLADELAMPADKYTDVELRCRYRYDHTKYFDGEIYSDWSKTISFGTDDINYNTAPVGSGTATPDEPSDPTKKTCPICHFCPQPLGLCIFIWLLIILAIIIIIVIIVAVAKKKKKNQ